MRLAVISPLHRSGATVVTTILAQAMALTQDLKTMVTYTDPERVLPAYVGKAEYTKDKTRSIAQIVELKRVNAISPDELEDFAIKVAPNFYLMDTVSSTVPEKDTKDVQKYVYTEIPSDFSVCDISEALDDPHAQELIKASDAVCYVLNPDNISIGAYKVWKESCYFPHDKPTLVILNRYDDSIVGVRQFAKLCGIEAQSLCKIHYSPMIVKACNEFFLGDIVPYAYDKDIRVLQLRTDIKEIMSWCTSITRRKLRWEK